jgi:uncharacterized protein
MEASTRPLALVTGASSGIGLELAREFATHDFDVIAVAEDDEIIDAVKDLQRHGTTIEALKVDLSEDDGVERCWEYVRSRGRPLDAVALNAGVGSGGAFAETDLEKELSLVDLNCRSTVHLAKYVVRSMVERDEGRILFTSSIAATMPGSFQAVYNASKSFVQSFALALREELKDTGITVTSLMPGPTETEFFERAEMEDTAVGASDSKDSPADVARDGFEALMAGKERVVASSMSTRMQGRGSRFLPDGIKAKMHRKMAEPGSAKDE